MFRPDAGIDDANNDALPSVALATKGLPHFISLDKTGAGARIQLCHPVRVYGFHTRKVFDFPYLFLGNTECKPSKHHRVTVGNASLGGHSLYALLHCLHLPGKVLDIQSASFRTDIQPLLSGNRSIRGSQTLYPTVVGSKGRIFQLHDNANQAILSGICSHNRPANEQAKYQKEHTQLEQTHLLFLHKSLL